jgi:2-polyprenyl-3-methyl-5-hydroxy-6-metoxy-1,4-benzoquinol methylase
LSFGGEDPQGLTEIIAQVLLKHNIFKPAQMSLIQGPLFKHNRWPQGVRVYKHADDIAELIKMYDLVITHFGLTCYEALARGVPVILFNPTAYHETLTKQAGLPSIGVKKPKVKKLTLLLRNEQLFKRMLKHSKSGRGHSEQTLLNFLLSCKIKGAVSCPLCKKSSNRVVARFREKSYFRCSRCGMIYLLYCGSKPIDYTKNYFFQNYKQQYGRTYLEDFSFIQELGRVRINEIINLLKKSKPVNLLDIGCAYGPFLKAASQKGLNVRGIDISEEAVRYVRDKLGIHCQTLDFENIPTRFIKENKKRYDVVSMWYVIEHIQNLNRVLAVINSMLKKGGVFAFSTPAACGISARKNFFGFLQNSPADHFTVWAPRDVKKQLKLFGFSVKKIKSTGHHAERFLPQKGLFLWILKLCSPIILFLSKVFSLGDTFEVYAVKESEYDDFT